MMAEARQTSPGIHRVFISSTSIDLMAHRQAVHDTLERMGEFAVDMAHFGARSSGDAVEVSTDKFASADIYIGIVAWRYGYVPPRRKRSVTHLEYMEAKRRGIPCFLFLADSTTERDETLFPSSQRDSEHALQLAAFRADLQRERVVDYFTTPDDLAKKVEEALHGHLLHQQDANGVNLVAVEVHYRKQVVEAYRFLRFSGFEQSDLFLDAVPLESIFVRLRLTIEQVRREPERPDEATHTSNKGYLRERVVVTQEPITLAQALRKPLLVVGEPGAGKSTLLRWLAVTFAKGTQRDPERIGPGAAKDCLPVLIELGRLPTEYLQGEGGKTPNWKDLLPTLLTAQERFAETPPALIHQALVAGRCLLLFDGLDEVANRQARVRLASSLAELPRLYPGSGMIIGSRTAGLRETEGILRPAFQRCEIQRFTPEDVQRFFCFWYALDQHLSSEQQQQHAEALYKQVQAVPSTIRLAVTPLLATILLLIWREDAKLPERRVDLYGRCCRVLLGQWEIHHLVNQQGLLATLGWERHLRLLLPIAHAIHRQEQRTDASREDLLPQLAEGLRKEGLCPTEEAARGEAERFLDELSLRSGLLQSQGNGRYGFPHLTFQEYLAARYLADQPDPLYIDLVMEHLHEAWWQEVHLLTIGHLGSSSQTAPKASSLLMAIISRYHPPLWFLRSSRHWWLRLIGPGKWLPGVQVEQRLAWMLRREEFFALWGATECVSEGLQPKVHAALSKRTGKLIRMMLLDRARHPLLVDWQNALGQRLPPPEQEAAVQALVAVLQHADPEIRRQAAASLGKIGSGSEAAVKGLLASLRDTYEKVYKDAATSLGQIGSGSEAAVHGLLDALQDANDRVSESAVLILGQIGSGSETTVHELLTMLQDADEGMRTRVTAGLALIGHRNEAAIHGLLALVQDKNSAVRRNAAWGLGNIGDGREAVVQGLLALLQDESGIVRLNAVWSLGQIGDGSEGAVQGLLAQLQDDDWEVRHLATESLGRIGAGGEAAVQGLVTALGDFNPDVRNKAASSLRQIGSRSEAALQKRVAVALRKGLWENSVTDDTSALVSTALYDIHPEMYIYATERLQQIGRESGRGSEQAIHTLVAALQDSDAYRRARAAYFLGDIGRGSEAAVQGLLAALQNADTETKRVVLRNLGRIGRGSEAVEQELVVALQDPDTEVRRNATDSLGQISSRSKEAVQGLVAALWDPDTEVRRNSAESLGQVEIKEPEQYRIVLVALNCCLHIGLDVDLIRDAALASIQQLLAGRSFPGSRWVPLKHRRAHAQRRKRFAFWLTIVAALVLISVGATWLSGILDPNGFVLRFLAVVGILIGFAAGVAQVLGWRLRDPWDHEK